MKFGRRRFLQSALATPLAAALGRPGVEAFAALLPPSGQSQFTNPQIIRYDHDCFTLNARDTFLRSASFHYCRCPEPLWEDRLLKIQRAGFNCLETYVFWNYHEPEEGHADLSKFESFVKAVKAAGLWMVVRPGPYVCAEWDAGGFPHWVIAKRFPLRSDNPQSIETSEHWYNLVLPVIQRNLITSDGPIIMVQIENEYDFCKTVSDSQKLAYLTALAQTAWSAGIDVPLITCWTRQARENSNPDMARIADFCNFYPRWKILPKVPNALTKLRVEEPSSPLGVTELEGGWPSMIGGKLSVEKEGVGPAQLNALTKTVLEDGVTFYNYYMGFGGTNFDWAAKGLTTSYDYAAPIREPGGLWEKYYEARGIALFLGMFGSVLARARRQEGAAQSTNPAVSVTERVNGQSAVLFVRENANAEQQFKLSFVDPASPSHRIINTPREGQLSLGAREMKMVAVQVPLVTATLRYSTAEVLAHGLCLDREFLILYDDPGRLAEIALSTSYQPQVDGNTAYLYWDNEYESVVIGARVGKEEQALVVNEELTVLLVPRERALRSWVAEVQSKALREEENDQEGEEQQQQQPKSGGKSIAIPFISDASLLASCGSHGDHLWAELDFRPGEHAVTALLPDNPNNCRVEGAKTKFQYTSRQRKASLTIATPELPSAPIELANVRTWVEKISGAAQGDWITSPLKPLEEFGRLPYGYVKYRLEHLTLNPQSKIFISCFTDDTKKVFLNGQLVPEASTPAKQVAFELAKYTKAADNRLEISYEAFGSSNGGASMGELKGVESVRVGADLASAISLGPWQIQRFPAPMRGREIDPEAPADGWSEVTAVGGGGTNILLPAFAWCRADFAMEQPPENWFVPWKLTFEASRDALLYLNGKFVGRYVTEGPQKNFYLPEPFFLQEEEEKKKKGNALTIVLAYAETAAPIRTLRIAPYREFATRRTRIEFEW